MEFCVSCSSTCNVRRVDRPNLASAKNRIPEPIVSHYPRSNKKGKWLFQRFGWGHPEPKLGIGFYPKSPKQIETGILLAINLVDSNRKRTFGVHVLQWLIRTIATSYQDSQHMLTAEIVVLQSYGSTPLTISFSCPCPTAVNGSVLCMHRCIYTATGRFHFRFNIQSLFMRKWENFHAEVKDSQNTQRECNARDHHSPRLSPWLIRWRKVHNMRYHHVL